MWLRACFADINVSQGSVATYAKCGKIFNIHLTVNQPRNLPLKFFNRLRFDSYGHESVATLFWPTLYALHSETNALNIVSGNAGFYGYFAVLILNRCNLRTTGLDGLSRVSVVKSS